MLTKELENDFLILGASALEDELQDQVPECISDFRKAGIKVWMITGDKLETAENIAFSCALLDSSQYIFRVNMAEEDRVLRRLEFIKDTITKTERHLSYYAGDEEITKIIKPKDEYINSEKLIKEKETDINISQQLLDDQNTQDMINFGLVIDGKSFHVIHHNSTATQLFAEITEKSNSIVICRASPSQKANVVQIVQKSMKNKRETLLAIGDGSNDVAMIHQANIGVGIYGFEGTEAASNSDYAVTEFKNLRRLLFYHGMNISYRLTDYINMFMFKSAMFALSSLFFAFYNGFSGQVSIMMFNLM